MNYDKLLVNLKKDVCSLLISSQLGLEPDQLRRDYTAMLGHPMPLRELGFRNVMDMVKEMPDVVSVHLNQDGSLLLKAVSTDATKNIEDLVAKQRVPKSCKKFKRKSGYYSSPRFSHFSRPVILPRRGFAPPVVPAVLRAQIQLLLSQGPIALSKLESAYQHCFGYRLNVQNFGFYSITDMLVSASDFISVQQTRFGSVLDLKGRILLNSSYSNFYRKVMSGKSSPNSSNAQPGVQVRQSVRKQAVEVKNKEDVQDSQRAPLFHEQVIKLEGEFRQQILQNGVAGSISQELKDKLLKVVGQSRDGIPVHSIPEEYQRVYGEEFPLTQSGFLNITDLIGAMNDTFHLLPNHSDFKHHWIVKVKEEIQETQQDQCQKSYYLNSEESHWEQEQDDNEADEKDEKPIAVLEKTQDEAGLQPESDLVIQVHCNPHVLPDAIQSQHISPPTKRRVRELVEVLVENVESPGNFYIRFSEGEEARALVQMMIEMRLCYNSPSVSKRYSLLDLFVRQGQVCCVSPEGMWFYRVVIHKILSDSRVEVFFVDFGDIKTVHTSNLKFLKMCFSVLPAQAVPSTLAGIKPKDGSWTTEATRSFQKMCCGGILAGALNCYIGDLLQLYLCDTHTEDDLYIHSALLAQGHGVACTSSASTSVCLSLSPVSLYMGEGKLHLPKVEWETLPPKPVESLRQMLSSGLKIDGEELPPLEFIGRSADTWLTPTKDKNPFQALITDQRELDISLSTAMGSPSSSPPPHLTPPSSTQTSQTQQKTLGDSVNPESSCAHEFQAETLRLQGSSVESSSIFRTLYLFNSHLGTSLDQGLQTRAGFKT